MNLRLSASMIKDFLSCQKKAYFRLNAPEEQEQTYQMAVGSIVHDTLEKYWNDYDKAIEFADNQIKRYNLKRGVSVVYKSLGNFFDNFTYLVHDTDEVERYFKVPYSAEVNLVGKFDRITKDGVLIDWKTGGIVPTDISSDAQFILYEYAYKKIFGDYPKRIFYVSLPSVKIIPYERNEALANQLFNEVIPYVIENLSYNIKNNSFVRNGLFGYKTCDNCPFSDICYKEIGL